MSVIHNTNQSLLPRLPPEVILLITEDDVLQWEDLRRLRHTCSFLFRRLGKRVLKARDFFFFRNACLHANVDILVECVKQNATPTGGVWKHPHDTPGQFLVRGFREGNFSVERFKHTWQWLSDNGYKLHMHQQYFGDSNGNTDAALGQYRAFSPDLMHMIWSAADAGHLGATCDAIHFVVDKGMVFPKLLRFSDDVNGSPPHWGLIGFMMAPYCPASILKLFLKQLGDQGLTLKSPIQNQIYRGEHTQIYTFTYELFRHHFDPCPRWGLEDPRGIADNFGDKVKALIKYNSVDKGEERVLKDIWKSLKKMARKRIERGSLDFDQDGLWFWYKLNMSVSYLATDRTVLKRMALDRQGFPSLEGATLHVFEHHNEHWYPPDRLCLIRKSIAEEKGPINPSKFEDRTKGDWYNMPLRDWDFFLVNDFSDCKGSLEHKATEDAWARLRRMRDGVPDHIPY